MWAVLAISLAVAASAATPERETTLLAGRYELVRRIGDGGYGTVWLALDHANEQEEVSVKLIDVTRPDKNSGASALHRSAQREQDVLVAAGVRHPNIVTFKGNATVEIKGRMQFLIATEYCAGGTLEDLHQQTHATKTPLDEDRIRHIIGGVCAGLHHLHRRIEPILHRDLKLSNVVLKDGVAKIIDFGVSADRERFGTATAGAMHGGGTYWYMSPARIHGRSHGADDDMWAVGVCLLELLTAHKFSRIELFGWMATTAVLTPVTLAAALDRARDAGAPESLVRVAEGLLDLDGATRWSAARAIRELNGVTNFQEPRRSAQPRTGAPSSNSQPDALSWGKHGQELIKIAVKFALRLFPGVPNGGKTVSVIGSVVASAVTRGTIWDVALATGIAAAFLYMAHARQKLGGLIADAIAFVGTLLQTLQRQIVDAAVFVSEQLLVHTG
jgi:eukaryotic-like serine/threonine-protein kinase